MLYKILKNNKKIFSIILLFIIISPAIFLPPETSQAAGGFALLEDYPGLGDAEKAIITGGTPSAALGTYVDWIVKFSLGLLSIGAVIMLIYAGIEYIGSETWSKKSDAKDRILRSIGALVLMFSAFIFFNQLNPELLKVRFDPIQVALETTTIQSVDDIWDGVIDFTPENQDKIIKSYALQGYNEVDCKDTGSWSFDNIDISTVYFGAAAGATVGQACNVIPVLGGITCGTFGGLIGGVGAAAWSAMDNNSRKALFNCTVEKEKYKEGNPNEDVTDCFLKSDWKDPDYCFYSLSKSNIENMEFNRHLFPKSFYAVKQKAKTAGFSETGHNSKFSFDEDNFDKKAEDAFNSCENIARKSGDGNFYRQKNGQICFCRKIPGDEKLACNFFTKTNTKKQEDYALLAKKNKEDGWYRSNITVGIHTEVRGSFTKKICEKLLKSKKEGIEKEKAGLMIQGDECINNGNVDILVGPWVYFYKIGYGDIDDCKDETEKTCELKDGKFYPVNP